MFDINLQTIIYYEIIFILVVLCAFMLLVLIKQKKIIQELREQFKALRKRVHHLLNEANHIATDVSTQKHGDPVDLYLHSVSQYALERFKKFVPDGIPSLNPASDFGAKVAALRYLYVMAEAENRAKQNAPENWLLLEKKLSDIVRWVRNIPKGSGQSGNRIKQLYEKVDQLKRHAAENSHLKRHLSLVREKNQTLEAENKNHKENIRKLQTMVSAFQRAFPGSSNSLPVDVPTVDDSQQSQRHERASNAVQGSLFQVNNISQISQRKQELLHELAGKFNFAFADADEGKKNNVEQKLKALETDIQGSEGHISSLQNELRTARNHIAQLKADAQQRSSGMDEPTSSLIIVENEETDAQAKPMPTSWIDNGGHERTLQEIEQLRNNNQRQRMLILELNSEINQLRESMNNTQDDKTKEEKNNEILKLERLVKECEYCIETLESEVDLLREQIVGGQEDEKMHPDIQKLNNDIEQISSKLHQTINQCSFASIINQFSVNLLEHNDIESIAQLIVDTLKKLNINFGFYLDCTITQIEYHYDGKSTPQEQKALKIIESSSPMGYLNEGILFSRPHVRIIIKNPPDEDETQVFIETTLNTIIRLTNAKINHIESLAKISRQDKSFEQSLVQVQHHLAGIQDQHDAHIESIRTIFDDLAKEVTAAIKLLNPPNSVLSVFENAISESHRRMDTVNNDSSNIRKHVKEITLSLEQLH